MRNRTELADFLRSRRARLQPSDAGLPGGDRRRTPGLRRQEVAQLAGISIDYYIRLEQGRGAHPSGQVLSALARALILTVDEREYLFRIAGVQPPVVRGPSREVSPSIRHLLASLTENPAYVVDAAYDILAWNAMMTHFIGDPAQATTTPNVVRWLFAEGGPETIWSDPDSSRFARSTVADLRAAYARYPGNPAITSLVTELLALSPQFAQLWAAHDVEVRGTLSKRVEHPREGPLEFTCDVLHIQATDQRLIVYCAAPGSPTRAAFHRLATFTRTPNTNPA